MSRILNSRLQLKGILIAESPLHIGGYGEDVDTDLPLARNGAGELYIPGTSLAGALRQWCEQIFGNDCVNCVWGFQDKKLDQGHASYIVVEDSLLKNGASVSVEIRDHVGIDREYGAAAEYIKFDRAILPRGTQFTFELTAEVTDDNRDCAIVLLAALKEALEAGDIRLGAAKTRGLGYVRLADATFTQQQLGTRNGILAVLRNNSGTPISQDVIAAAQNKKDKNQQPRLHITINWEPIGPLMVKAGYDGIASDMLPLTSGCSQKVALVLPGSSVKGAWRSHAECIVRTVTQQSRPGWLGKNDKQKFMDAVEVGLVNELFGQRRKPTRKNNGESGERQDREAGQSSHDWSPGLGALSVKDCFATQALSPEIWNTIQSADDDKQLRDALKKAELCHWSQAYHVAVDRWLGSAAEGMLYTVLEPHAVVWEPLCVELNMQRLPKSLHLPAVALLFLLLRDFANGRVPLGFGTHRGMGTVRVKQITIQGINLPSELHDLSKVELANGNLQGLPAHLLRALTSKWQDWIRSAGANE